jgi:putative oxidoreductase
MPNRSSHPILSCTDGLASGLSDAFLLLARICLALVFIMTAYHGNPTPTTLGNHGFPMPAVASMIAITSEFAFGVALILGVGTRYAALLGIIYVVIATATAHLWWQYPAAQQVAQFTNFMKNTAIIGGFLAIFVVGAGRFSVDALLSQK